MSDLRALYQEMILDHNKNPRNFRAMEDADRQVEGYNPLCGDRYTVYVKLEDGRITDVSFTGSGCAISKASASMMGGLVKGKTIGEVEELFGLFHDLVMGKSAKGHDLGKLEVFAGVSEYPARVKCASLAWHTLKNALESKNETVTTE